MGAKNVTLEKTLFSFSFLFPFRRHLMAGESNAENPHMAGMVGTQFVPVEGEKISSTSGKFSKYSDTSWKPLVGPKTPLSMMQAHPDSSHYPDTYTKESRGVVPGYQGHVPRARDTFGSSAVGGLAPDMHVGAHKKMGVMSGHEEQAYGSKRSEGPLGAGELNSSAYTSFSEKKTGVMPGCARLASKKATERRSWRDRLDLSSLCL